MIFVGIFRLPSTMQKAGPTSTCNHRCKALEMPPGSKVCRDRSAHRARFSGRLAGELCIPGRAVPAPRALYRMRNRKWTPKRALYSRSPGTFWSCEILSSSVRFGAGDTGAFTGTPPKMQGRLHLSVTDCSHGQAGGCYYTGQQLRSVRPGSGRQRTPILMPTGSRRSVLPR